MPKSKEIQNVAIVGTGVIGASWAALYLARGLNVVATDPAPNAEANLRRYIDGAWKDLTVIGLPPGASRDRLTFTLDIKKALADADFVQENGPDRKDFKIKLFSASGKPVDTGKPGEVVARGANVMRGYWNNPKDTELAFHNGMLRTGDIGYLDSDGYCYILDRLKDMIVTGVENVYSGEVEAVISEHPAVQEAAVFGIPDPQWVELVAACVVVKPGMALSMEDLIGYYRQFLANYKIPRRVEFSETELPKSGPGKILKRILRERYWAHQEPAVS